VKNTKIKLNLRKKTYKNGKQNDQLKIYKILLNATPKCKLCTHQHHIYISTRNTPILGQSIVLNARTYKSMGKKKKN